MPLFAKDLKYVMINKQKHFGTPRRVAVRKGGSHFGMFNVGEVCLDANPEFQKYLKDDAFDVATYVNDHIIKEKTRWADKTGWGVITANSKAGWAFMVYED